MGLLYAIILIGVLVFVHEFGHFLVAKLFKVKVLQFSIGYGPSIVSFYYGETEYCIKAFPLGGYVLMLGSAMDEVEDLPEEDRQRSLMGKPIWQRALVTLAGPAANIVFPLFLYFVMLLSISTAQPSIIGEVFADMPAASSGLKPGDRITKIDSKEINYWQEVQDIVSANPEKELSLEYARNGTSHSTKITPKESFQTDSLGLSRRSFGLIGITYTSYGPTVAVPDPTSAAANAGLKTFDRIIAINDHAIKRYDEILPTISASQSPAKLLIFRPIPVNVDWGTVYRNDIIHVTLPTVTTPPADHYGLDTAEMYVSVVEPNSPAAKAGFRPRDKILTVNGKPYRNWFRVTQTITNEVNAEIVKVSKEGGEPEKINLPFKFEIERDGTKLTLDLIPGIRQINKQEAFRVILGFQSMVDYSHPDKIAYPLTDRIPNSFFGAFSETWNIIKLTASGLWGMVSGRFGLDNLGGPIMIGNLAAKAGDAGIRPFLQMMGLISINLAIMNLLPIPMFDGGHLLIYLVEAIQRRPISFRTRQIISYLGIVIIILLFIMAFKNDIERSWDDIVVWLNQ